jgi:hypothetical protein
MTNRPETLERLLKAREASENALPYLVPPEHPLKPVWKKLADWAEQFFDWLGWKSRPPEVPESLVRLLPYLLGGLFALGIFLALYATFRAFKARPRQPRRADAPAVDDESLSVQLAQARDAGDFARAARLRWKIFLRRRREPAARTPQELLPEQPSFVTRQYRLMFGVEAQPADRFGDLDDTLGALEQREPPR